MESMLIITLKLNCCVINIVLLFLEIVCWKLRNTVDMKGGRKQTKKKIAYIQIIHKIIIVIILSCDHFDVLNSCQKTITFHR